MRANTPMNLAPLPCRAVCSIADRHSSQKTFVRGAGYRQIRWAAFGANAVCYLRGPGHPAGCITAPGE